MFGEHTGCSRLHNLRIPPDVGSYYRGTARHRFKEHISPTFSARRQDKGIRRTVYFGEHLMRSGAQQANLIRYSNASRKMTECLALRALTDYYKIEVRQLPHRLDYTIVPFALDQMADGK